MKTIKLFSGILAGITLMTVAAPSAAAEEIASEQGATSLEIVDFLLEDGLPGEPGEFVINTVPNIDFGQVLLSEANAGTSITGEYKGKFNVTDSRPTAIGQSSALAAIEAYEEEGEDETSTSLKAEWNAASLAANWSISAIATNLIDEASSFLIGNHEILEEAATIHNQTYQAGTFDVELDAAKLTLATNNLSAGTYEGEVTYTVANAE